MSRRRWKENDFGCFLRSMCGCQLVSCLVARVNGGGGRGVDREASGSRNGWIETETEREMDAAVCACQRQGHPLGDFKHRHCHFGYHGDTVNEHTCRKIAANHSLCVLRIHGGDLYLQATLAVSLFLPFSSSLSFFSTLRSVSSPLFFFSSVSEFDSACPP